MPNFKPYSDSLIVAKLKNGDVILSMMSFLDANGEYLRLSSLNTRRPSMEVAASDLEWIYPVWGVKRKVWHPEGSPELAV